MPLIGSAGTAADTHKYIQNRYDIYAPLEHVFNHLPQLQYWEHRICLTVDLLFFWNVCVLESEKLQTMSLTFACLSPCHSLPRKYGTFQFSICIYIIIIIIFSFHFLFRQIFSFVSIHAS